MRNSDKKDTIPKGMRRMLDIPNTNESDLVKVKGPSSVPTIKVPLYRPKKTTIRIKKERESDEPLCFDCHELTKALEKGPCGFRAVVGCGALFSLVAACLDYWDRDYYEAYYGDGDGSDFLFFVITCYIWVFSVFILTLELPPFRYEVSILHIIVLRFLKVLRFSWGRGLLYFFSGSLQLSLFTKYNIIAGSIMISLGLISFYLGHRSTKKMDKLFKKINNKDNIERKFAMYDSNNDGYLDPKEFSRFCRGMGIFLSRDDLVNIFSSLDTDYDRFLSKRDIQRWWIEYKYQQKNGSAGMSV